MKLSDTQRIILSQASQRDDRLAIPPERLPAAAIELMTAHRSPRTRDASRRRTASVNTRPRSA